MISVCARHQATCTVFAAILGIASGTVVVAQTCVPPPGFVEMQRPALTGLDPLVAHTEEVTVPHSLAEVLDAGARTSLKDAIHKAGGLPGVTGVYPLGTLPFPAPGARHIVCLSDGSTLQEESLNLERTPTTSRFRYIVWHYTSSQARPIEYGIGEFRDIQIDAGHTHIVWTYSFKLKDNEFPGYFGCFGRYVFKVGFLDRQYAAMMRATLRAN